TRCYRDWSSDVCSSDLISPATSMTRNVAISLLVFCAGLSAQPRLIKGAIQDSRRTRMGGHVHPMATAANDIGALDQGTTLPALKIGRASWRESVASTVV